LSQPTQRIRPIIGTDKLGRPFTNEERDYAAFLLRENDFVGASLVALRFAYKLTRRMAAAQDLKSRMNMLVVRYGWDPNEVPLVKCLCRYVWVEWTHQSAETAKARKAEEGYLRELEAEEGIKVPSTEDYAARLEAEREEEERAKSLVEELRQAFVASKDEVNLIWLELWIQGETDLQKMAERSGRDPKEFYRATDRRKRLFKKIVAARRGENPEETD
jgi:hypothetical protein